MHSSSIKIRHRLSLQCLSSYVCTSTAKPECTKAFTQPYHSDFSIFLLPSGSPLSMDIICVDLILPISSEVKKNSNNLCLTGLFSVSI